MLRNMKITSEYSGLYHHNIKILVSNTYQNLNVVMIAHIDLEPCKLTMNYGVVSCILSHFFLLISSVPLEWLAEE